MSAEEDLDGRCNLEYVETKTGDKSRILEAMILDFPSSSVTAILGPSGSGKTTLLSVVTGSIPANVEARADVFLPGMSAFVPQDDRLHGFYRVRSYLKHYAQLAGITEATDEKIDSLMNKLGLSDQADTIVGDLFFKGLSGGQQRRLSLALEALSEPANFFLDEPTSGLDAESALQIMEFLKDYAREAKGRRVVLTIHQPSSFIWQTIDHVVLLSRGRLMFNGPRSSMEAFFEQQGYPTPKGWNEADHYVMSVNDEFRNHPLSVLEWAERFEAWSEKPGKHGKKRRSSSTLGADQLVRTSRRQSPFVIVELTKRYFLNMAFNPGILGTRVAMYTMLALMVGALFWNLGDRIDFESVQSRIAISFYCVAFFIFMSVAVLPFTVMERAIVDKEVLNGYYNPIYYQISQAISSIPGCAILAFLVTLIIVTMVNLNDPFWYFLTMFLSLMVAEALAHVVSHCVPHFIIGIALLAGLFGFFMLYLGFMIIPSDFPNWLGWLYYCAFHTYAWRTFMYSEFSNISVLEGGGFTSGHDVLVFYEIEDVDRGNDMIVLVGYCLFCHIVACVVLHLRYKLFDGKVQRISDAYQKSLVDRTLRISKHGAQEEGRAAGEEVET